MVRMNGRRVIKRLVAWATNKSFAVAPSISLLVLSRLFCTNTMQLNFVVLATTAPMVRSEDVETFQGQHELKTWS